MLALQAVGSSASSINLRWTAVAGASVPWRIAGRLQAESQLGANGRLMQGIQVRGDLAWDWSFTLNDE